MAARLLITSVGFLVAFSLSACGNGGSINFNNPGNSNPTNNRGVGVTFVPASQALAIESGKTTATGYHAKLQLNPLQSTELTGSSYKLKLKHTVRNH